MSYVPATLLIGLIMVSPIDKVDHNPQDRLNGQYVGTSSFTASSPADKGYEETTGIWFIFEDTAYYYGEGNTLPEPGGAGDGGGPYEVTDSTVALNGVYPKILRPVIVLRGVYRYELSGDTLTMTQPSVDGPGGGHRLRLIRQ